QRVVTADRFTSCHTRSLHGLRQPVDRLQPRVQELCAEPANVPAHRTQTIYASDR
ncbi:MAG: hypothetical protein HC769_32370, partial [Cyanobacteria bacterium CRU_2_1]|nr:hypothetical protein [Cyanobacteria bacterium CRU_2_1]